MFDGRETIGLASNRIARLGLAFCPEERGIFASLNVEENLFFFSSRRRHTRFSRDWSSDVCSSDLPRPRRGAVCLAVLLPPRGRLGPSDIRRNLHTELRLHDCASRVQPERARLLPSEGLPTMWPGRF